MYRLPHLFTGKFAYHVFLRSPKGHIYGFGGNESYALGLENFSGSSRNVFVPTLVKKFSRNNKSKPVFYISSIKVGNTHTIFLSKKGIVFVAGKNKKGQCGNPSTIKVNKVATELDCSFSEEKIVYIECGESITFFMNSRGKIWGCGECRNGQLGIGREGADLDIFKPTMVILPKEVSVKEISAGIDLTIFLSKRGVLYVAGGDVIGILNDLEGNSTSIPMKVDFPRFVCQVSCSESHMLLVTDEKRMYVSGSNGFGELGIGIIGFGEDEGKDFLGKTTIQLNKNIVNVKEVICGWQHSLLQLFDGNCYGFGCSYQGQVGSDYKEHTIPKLVKIEQKRGSEIIQFGCGGHQSYFLTKDFRLFGCGLASDGGLLDAKGKRYSGLEDSTDESSSDIDEPKLEKEKTEHKREYSETLLQEIGKDFMKEMKLEFQLGNPKVERIEFLIGMKGFGTEFFMFPIN